MQFLSDFFISVRTDPFIKWVSIGALSIILVACGYSVAMTMYIQHHNNDINSDGVVDCVDFALEWQIFYTNSSYGLPSNRNCSKTGHVSGVEPIVGEYFNDRLIGLVVPDHTRVGLYNYNTDELLTLVIDHGAVLSRIDNEPVSNFLSRNQSVEVIEVEDGFYKVGFDPNAFRLEYRTWKVWINGVEEHFNWEPVISYNPESHTIMYLEGDNWRVIYDVPKYEVRIEFNEELLESAE